MSVQIVANKRPGHEVMASLQGQAVASKLLYELRAGCAPKNALLHAIRDARDGDRLKGFAAELQRALERA